MLESVLVLLVPTALCLSWRRAASATRHLVWFAGVATLPLLLCLAVLPHTWPAAAHKNIVIAEFVDAEVQAGMV